METVDRLGHSRSNGGCRTRVAGYHLILKDSFAMASSAARTSLVSMQSMQTDTCAPKRLHCTAKDCAASTQGFLELLHLRRREARLYHKTHPSHTMLLLLYCTQLLPKLAILLEHNRTICNRKQFGNQWKSNQYSNSSPQKQGFLLL